MNKRLKEVLVLLFIVVLFYGAIEYKKLSNDRINEMSKLTIDLDSLSNYQVLKIDTLIDNDTVVKTAIYRIRVDSHFVIKDFNAYQQEKWFHRTNKIIK